MNIDDQPTISNTSRIMPDVVEPIDMLEKLGSTKPKLSKHELAKQRQKDADRRSKANKKRRFDMFTQVEKELMKRQRHEEEECVKARLLVLAKDLDYAPLGAKAPITVCIDCSLDYEHDDRERRSLCKQLCFGYASVKKLASLDNIASIRLCMSGLGPHPSESAPAEGEGKTLLTNDTGVADKSPPSPPQQNVLLEMLTKQGILNWKIPLFYESIWDLPRLRKLCAEGDQFKTVASHCGTPEVKSAHNDDINFADSVSEPMSSFTDIDAAAALTNPPEKPSKFDPVVPLRLLPLSSSFCQSSSFVMLSPDATEVLTHFDPSKVYIIGGIVDRSVRSTRTRTVSTAKGISCQRLPIQEYIPTRYTHVLNVDTVLKIICLYNQYDGDWKKVLEEAVPLRKQGKSVNQLRDKKGTNHMRGGVVRQPEEKCGSSPELTNKSEDSNESDSVKE